MMSELSSASSIPAFADASANYSLDAWQRWILFLDVMGRRAEQYEEHAAQRAPHVLDYEVELICDARTFEEPVNYEPDMKDGLAAAAQAQARNVFDLALEWLMEKDGKQILLHTFENYWSGDLEVVRALLEDDATVCGLKFFGVDHVLFASDCPFEPTPGVYVRETLDVVTNQLGLSSADHAQIVDGNARRLMPNLRT